MSDDPEAIRHEAAVLARKKKARMLQFPCDWRPGAVKNPQDGNPFTDAAAWIFIADLLEPGNQPIECITLDNPPGKKGYVMIPGIGDRKIYIKFMLGAGTIIGRSFHYSNQP